MAKGTRERILDAALEIFSRDGYAGTNIKDIADSVGIVKSALYRHFDSKEDIFNAVLERVKVYYEERFGSVEKLPDLPRNTDELYRMTMRMVDFTIHDPKIIRMRKLLSAEQFRDERFTQLANHYFLYDTKAIFSKVFCALMENGAVKKNDPDILALAYTAPVTALIHLCDREPEKEQEIMDQIRRFVSQFIDTYKAVSK